MNYRLAALVAASFAFAQIVHASGDPRSARQGFAVDTTSPGANPALSSPSTPLVNNLSEGFDNIAGLVGAGWFMQNNSTPLGVTGWSQGPDVAGNGPFNAFDGATNSFISANFNNTTGGTGTISNWLLTPQLDFGASATLTFYTRKPTIGAGQTDYPDRLEVRYSTTGASTNVGTGATAVGDFTTLSLSVNPTLVVGGYPQTWTQYTITGLPHSGGGRVAFRYYVTNGGPTGTNSDFIGIDRVVYSAGAPEYQIGGSVSGLAGSGLVLRLNGANDLPMNADGTFTFPPYVTQGGSYDVTVATQPSNLSQTCSVANGNGTATGTVTNVQVTCVTNAFSIGGSVGGLAGSGLTLQVNGGQDLAISADGTFSFPTSITDGSAYAVTVSAQPTNLNQNCVVSNGSGTLAGANVSDVQVTCTTLSYFIGGNVSGLAGSGLVLHLDSGQDVPVAANGSFMFANPVTDGSAYTVSVGTPPSNPNQSCTVTGGSGTLAGSDVTSVQVSCTTLAHTVGGNVTGLSGNGLVLQLNGGDDLPVPADGAFVFSQAVQEGGSYAVTILSQPSGGASYRCFVANGNGTMNTQAVSDIAVACDVIFLSGFEAP
jgi:hypothetical protein